MKHFSLESEAGSPNFQSTFCFQQKNLLSASSRKIYFLLPAEKSSFPLVGKKQKGKQKREA
jgi:hypothetical protein